jgi:hypothetical protein
MGSRFVCLRLGLFCMVSSPPPLFSDTPLALVPDGGYGRVAATLRSLGPRIVEMGIASAE